MTPEEIIDINKIDIDSHLVIEASAGTGKTYTIEHLVVNLLKSGRVSKLEEILVVTYTEKATGELRDRIRNKIGDALKIEKSEILQVSLDNFDSASVYTIHGFCNRVLQNHAFENREPFQFEVVEDGPIYKEMLYRQMREDWHREYGDSLYELLMLSGFPNSNKNILNIALRYQPLAGDRIMPEPNNDLPGLIKECKKTIRNELDNLYSQIGVIDEHNPENSDFYSLYQELKVDGRSSKPLLNKLILPVINLLIRHRTDALSFYEVSDFFKKSSYLANQEHGFNVLMEKLKDDLYRKKFPNLPKIVEILEKIRSLDYEKPGKQFLANAICRLKSDVFNYKQENGLISFEDMLNLVSRALDMENSILKSILQRKYKYAIVDEFQDTDMLQWNIFKKLFLESGNNRLFIIGDPKQAIYGFRGADVFAYFTAKEEMIHKHNAKFYSLTNNWRSVPGLLNSFNKIFQKRNWFMDERVVYYNNRSPKNDENFRKIIDIYKKDPDNLIIHNLGECSGSEARYRMAGYISFEIQRLLEQKDPPVAPDEIAILVRKGTEAEIVENELIERNIKYSFYKKEGLYQSDESTQLSYLLAAIAGPGDQAFKKMLLTDFFNIPVSELKRYESIPSSHIITRLLEKWNNLAAVREWSGLFQSILLDSGILFRLISSPNWERSMSNYLHIMQDLEIEAYINNHGINDILNSLNSLRNQLIAANNNSNLHRIETEEPRVQIMTIHASKGLEFKVVFVAGGYTKPGVRDYWTYHKDGNRVFDLIKEKANQSDYEIEQEGEDERLYYVALTRAAYRLYVPEFKPTKRSSSKNSITGSKLPGALETVREEANVKNVMFDIMGDDDEVEPEQGDSSNRVFTIPDPLFPETGLKFLNRKIRVESFSGLKNKIMAGEGESLDALPEDDLSSADIIGFGDNRTPVPGEDDYELMWEQKEDTVVSKGLPHGKNTGSMLHEILEEIDFLTVRDSGSYRDLISEGTESNMIIEDKLGKFMLSSDEEKELYRNEIARLIWNTLNTSLEAGGFKLCELAKKVSEMEFYYPIYSTGGIDIPGTGISCGRFIHGYIDLVFEHNDKFYILDWKSNYIEEGYDRSLVEKNIYESRYDMQFKIYIIAVIRWLKQVLPEFRYRDHFGGVYYLYLRGMNVTEPDKGIFYYRPENEGEITEFEKQLFK